MLTVIMLSVVFLIAMLSVIMLNIVMLNVAMLNVIMLSVVAPTHYLISTNVKGKHAPISLWTISVQFGCLVN